MVKFKEKRAESCHAQMSTFFGTLINKMQPSVDKMFVTPQRQAWKGLLPKSPGCQEKKFHFCEFPLVSRKRTTAEEQLADSSLGTGFHQGRWSNQKMVLTNPHLLQIVIRSGYKMCLAQNESVLRTKEKCSWSFSSIFLVVTFLDINYPFFHHTMWPLFLRES